MRIVVSGTHASGKSTLISDFAARHPEYGVLPDPFELIDETWDAPGAGMFRAQLRVAADRLTIGEHGDRFIAERGPLDFLAYLIAMDAPVEQVQQLAAAAMRRVDLLVVLPLTPRDRIEVSDEEDPVLRRDMDEALLELIDDADLVGERTTVVEVTGDPAPRLAALEAAAGLA